MGPDELTVPAADAARRALAELDEERLTPPLRRVNASSARTLPPPLLRLLVRQLDREDWLRRLAAERIGEEPAGDDDLARIWSWLFLARPDGWEARLAEIAGQAAELREREGDRLVEEENRRLRERLELLESLLTEASAHVQREAAAGDDAAATARLRESNGRLRARMAELEAEVASAAAQAEAIAEELDRADVRIAELKRRLATRRERTDPGRLPTEVPTGAGRAFGGGDPAALGRFLDDLQRSVARGARKAPAARSIASLEVPSGVRPDRPEAIEWLLRLPEPATLLIDGYNVAFHIRGEPDAAFRTRVENLAGRIARLADGPLAVVVFWDSQMGTDRVRRRAAGIDVRFSASADDAIVETAATAVNPVVITGDRELRERAARHGAIVLWSAAATAWRSEG